MANLEEEKNTFTLRGTFVVSEKCGCLRRSWP